MNRKACREPEVYSFSVSPTEKEKELNLLLDVGTEKYMMSSDASLTGY